MTRSTCAWRSPRQTPPQPRARCPSEPWWSATARWSRGPTTAASWTWIPRPTRSSAPWWRHRVPSAAGDSPAAPSTSRWSPASCAPASWSTPASTAASLAPPTPRAAPWAPSMTSAMTRVSTTSLRSRPASSPTRPQASFALSSVRAEKPARPQRPKPARRPSQTRRSGRPPSAYRSGFFSPAPTWRPRWRSQVRWAHLMTATAQKRSAQASATLTYWTPGTLTGRTSCADPSSAASWL